MSYVSILEFQNITGISDLLMLRLLKDNRLPLSLDPKKGLRIDTTATETSAILRALLTEEKTVLTNSRDLIVAEFGEIIRKECAEIIRRGIAVLTSRQNNLKSVEPKGN